MTQALGMRVPVDVIASLDSCELEVRAVEFPISRPEKILWDGHEHMSIDMQGTSWFLLRVEVEGTLEVTTCRHTATWSQLEYSVPAVRLSRFPSFRAATAFSNESADMTCS